MATNLRFTPKSRKLGIKWLIYAIILIGILCYFTPKLLISKASKILDKNIIGDRADSLPKSEVFVANNYLHTARYFPGFDAKGAEGQKLILDYYFPLFKADYDKLKFACVDNAITQLTKQGVDKDSARIQALESAWKKYPDTTALNQFRKNWDTYHKSFTKSLPDYYRFVDAAHLR